MARRNRRSPESTPRPLAIGGSHWRSDGAAKSRYSNKQEAASAAHFRWVEDRVELTVYSCEFCNGWHMGRIRPER